MKGNKNVRVEDYTSLYRHRAARPLGFFKDKEGYGWLCDKKTDPTQDLREQGCWRCDEMAFPMGGR